MKVNLSYDNPNILSGYLTFDPFATGQGGDKRIKIEMLERLEQYIDKGECVELRAYNILEYISFYNIKPVLIDWIGRIRQNGILNIACTDYKLCQEAYEKGNISIEQFNSLIFGEQRKTRQFKKSAVPFNIVRDIMIENGMQIKAQLYDDTNYVIKGKKL